MANIQRTDPSSLSLGRAVRQAQADAAFAKAEVEQLKKAQPTKQATQDAELAGRTIRAQRRRANQMFADIAVMPRRLPLDPQMSG